MFHIAKRSAIEPWKAWLIRLVSILAALIVCALIIVVLTKENPVQVYASMFKGSFGSPRKIWILLQNIAILEVGKCRFCQLLRRTCPYNGFIADHRSLNAISLFFAEGVPENNRVLAAAILMNRSIPAMITLFTIVVIDLLAVALLIGISVIEH